MSRTQPGPRGPSSRNALRRVGVLVAVVGGFVVLLAISRSLAPPQTTPRTTAPWSDRCIGVADGDTISVMQHGVEVRVRLNAVDCPEKGQAFGNAAKRFTSNWAFGKVVTVSPMKIDLYGRTVGDVRTPDGRSLNQALVAAGLAWWYRQYAPDDRTLAALEADARRARRGLWADANPVPPWEFRRRMRAAGRERS